MSFYNDPMLPCLGGNQIFRMYLFDEMEELQGTFFWTKMAKMTWYGTFSYCLKMDLKLPCFRSIQVIGIHLFIFKFRNNLSSNYIIFLKIAIFPPKYGEKMALNDKNLQFFNLNQVSEYPVL